jgi:hypothetical protein
MNATNFNELRIDIDLSRVERTYCDVSEVLGSPERPGRS